MAKGVAAIEALTFGRSELNAARNAMAVCPLTRQAAPRQRTLNTSPPILGAAAVPRSLEYNDRPNAVC